MEAKHNMLYATSGSSMFSMKLGKFLNYLKEKKKSQSLSKTCRENQIPKYILVEKAIDNVIIFLSFLLFFFLTFSVQVMAHF